MGRQLSALVDDDVGQAARREDLIRDRAAAARVEDIAFKEEQGDSRMPHRAEQVIEPGGRYAMAQHAHGMELVV
jgi:hypothetical protein